MHRKLNPKRGGFTLVEIMIVVAIIALLASIAVPNFLRSRKRSQATQVLQDLRVIDAAVDLYAIENNKGSGATVVCVHEDYLESVNTIRPSLITTMRSASSSSSSRSSLINSTAPPFSRTCTMR